MGKKVLHWINRIPDGLKRRLPALLIVLVVMTACEASQSASETPSAPSQSASSEVSTPSPSPSATPLPGGEASEEAEKETSTDDALSVTEDGAYTSKEEVALYIHTYGHLPENFITKREAQELGWDSSKGNLDEVAPGKSIGGDRFGNYEGNLPDGHRYKECDINYAGGYRGAERIVFSDDGLIFYTNDHYNTFEQLYEGE